MIKAILFDLTDTLQEFDWAKQWKLLNKEVQNVDKKEFKRIYQQVYESYRLGWIKNDKEFFELVFRQLGVNVTKEQINKLVKKHLVIRKKFTWLPKEYEKTLTELKKKYKLAVVSSGVATWAYYDFINIFGFNFKKHFDQVIFSQEQGYLKESGKLFEIALKKLKIKNTEAIYVGNSYEDDVKLARKHKIKTVFLNKKKEKFKGDYTIKELRELVKIL